MTYSRALLVCFAICGVSTACKPEKAVPAAGGTASAESRPRQTCPVKVPATTVTVMNTADGVAMYFTTLPAHLAEVRQRTSALATHVAAASTAASGAAQRGASLAVWESAARPRLLPLRATAEPTADGARLVLMPLSPEHLGVLRAYARAQGDRMRLGECPAEFSGGREKPGADGAMGTPAAHAHD